MMKVAFFMAILATVALGDMYLHNPRGCNNRLDEQNRNRNNANRLFDSQNNNKGGYNQNTMEYYSHSIIPIEWTNQHSCADQNNNCMITLQYMCDRGTAGAGIRDGQIRNTIDPAMPDDPKYGRHETYESYAACVVRERNMGLFTADQNLNQDTAMYTRQNTNGQRYGLECAEERDYYPYWHPSDWIDIAILTDDVSRCAYYQEESANVKGKNYCNGTRNVDAEIVAGAMYNNEADCTGNGFQWVASLPWSDKENTKTPIDPKNIENVDCRQAPWSRDNHLGNGVNGYANTYDWVLPETDEDLTCVLRARYNISTDDIPGWTIDASMNQQPPNFVNGVNMGGLENDPTVTLATGVDLKLAMNTDQYFRTFQDRSSTFVIKPRPTGVSKKATIYNLNVKGQRGNIVQNYPAVEYDFAPSNLAATTSDYVHRQASGSNTTPAGAGQGSENTDRFNWVQIDSANENYPTMLSMVTQCGEDVDPMSDEGYLVVKEWALLEQNDNEIDDAATHIDLGLTRYSDTGAIHYMNSRNNNFTNRSQKGVVNITQGNGLGTLPIVLIAAGVTLGVAAPASAVAYGVAKPDSGMGRVVRKPFGKGTSDLPPGYRQA